MTVTVMNKKILYHFTAFFILIFMHIGCKSSVDQQKQAKQNPNSDSLHLDQISEKNYSSFNDFIYNFSTDSLVQFSCIDFPLNLIENKIESSISKEEFEFTQFGFGVEFSTILFNDTIIDSEKEFYEVLNDSMVCISSFMREEQLFKRFYFNHRNGSWILIKVETDKIIDHPERESFFKFISRFHSDKSFTNERIYKSATLTEYDNDSGAKVETRIDADNYQVNDYLFKTVFIYDFNENAKSYTLFVKGEGTGYHSEYYFQMIDGKWYLVMEVNLGM